MRGRGFSPIPFTKSLLRSGPAAQTPQERSRGDSFLISAGVSAPYFLARSVFRQSSNTEISRSAIPGVTGPQIYMSFGGTIPLTVLCSC